MHIGLLTQWYDPEPGPAALPGVLARGLLQRGHSVQVLTGFPNYPTGRLVNGYKMTAKHDERLAEVAVRRVALYPSHDGNPIHRVINYASFGASASLLGLGVLRELDAIWVYCSPITISWPMWVARYGFGVPSVIHVMDLWPDTISAGGFGRETGLYNKLRGPLNSWCNAIYRSASAVAYISPGVKNVLRARGVPDRKLHYVPLWTDETVFQPSSTDLRLELGLGDDQIILLYAGSLGDAQGLHSLIDACVEITDPRFVAIIAGSGVAEGSLRERARRAGVQNVRFLGRIPQTKMTELMATADLSYVSLRSHALSAVTMPSKVQAALAAGRALVIAAEGDVSTVGRECGAAFLTRPEDPAEIAAAISMACSLGRDALAERGRRGRRYYEATFSAHQGVARIERLLIAASAARATTV